MACIVACGGGDEDGRQVITFPASAVGAEAELLQEQLERFMLERPDVRIVRRETPDAADQRHQLYVQWLNARASDPDILQLDVIWTPEFAAAGWILPLDAFAPPVSEYFPATVAANRWDGALYALPWFVDVGMLYWRTDLFERPPASLEELSRAAARSRSDGTRYGMVWQGARYEGLVTVFLEHLGAFGGQIMDADGRVVVDSNAAVRALRFMADEIYETGNVPRAALTWQEEQTRFVFQNGQAAFMRNWPYAYPLLRDSAASRVAGRFAVAPMPAAPEGEPTATLGGSQLAINANTENPEAAYAVIEYLTRPEQMLERARVVGQYPTRPALYGRPELARGLSVPPDRARRIIERAVPRPVTPVYTQLSQLLQIRLHRALTGQQEPRAALEAAAAEMRALLEKVGLAPGESAGARR
ncbi:MAG: extracellular solute-binding protein [Gemmatimonadetes bacterium]|nr:ABC transporter substrate-binding protein [Gemmatimonadota bacterium]NIT68747.1 ABC transporter substrate-binding protein [Gemmatimonadota bacterium]NIV25429.1 extracellular solute-binding protein [Gemmatimonadota bacterium]NIW38800.1 extracellular solute-binding protein [Gemmatimonadota bacterium]NIW77474.1 extracellular solute-binding protein [Gemmatimonadota bacterium]